MKKLLSVLLITVILVSAVFGLTSCFEEKEGLTPDEFTLGMNDIDDIELVDLGNNVYSYSETSEVSWAPAEYTVKCDDDGFITYVEIKCTDINNEMLSSAETLMSIYNSSTNENEELAVACCLLRLDSLCETVSGNPISVKESAEMLANGSTGTYGDWEVSVNKNISGTVVLTATLSK